MESDYLIVMAETADDLTALVNARLAAGWETRGGATQVVLVQGGALAQTLVKTDRQQLEGILLNMANEAFMFLRKPAVVSVLHEVKLPPEPREPWQGDGPGGGE